MGWAALAAAVAGADALGVISHDAGPVAAAGLRHRDLADAAAGALAHERELGLDRERKAGLTPAEEAELLS